MQSASTARLTRTPLAVILVLVIGLLAGLAALELTHNLPGRGAGTAQVRQDPAILAPSAGDGLVSPRHLEGVLGPGATLDTLRPMIKGEPSYGQGEGFVGPGADLGGSIIGGSTGDRADTINGMGETSSNEYVAGPCQVAGSKECLADDSSSTATEYVVDPYRGGVTDH